METETPAEAAPEVAAPAPAEAPVAQDEFAIDEAKFLSLSPEQRASLDPVLNEWKTKAKSKIEETGKTWEEKYKPAEEKAKALDQLVQDPRFVTFWNNLQQGVANAVPGAAQAAQAVQPRDIATPEEWQQAVAEAYVGNGQRLQGLQARMIQAMAAPVVQQLQQGQEELRTTLEMRDLLDRHKDAWELDKIGRDPANPNDANKSLLEIGLEWAAENRKPMEDGYKYAKRLADAIRVGAKQEAMGMVAEKKASVTSGPTTSQGGQGVVEVADSDELMSRNMEYILAGEKPPRFVIRQGSAKPDSRWSQRT